MIALKGTERYLKQPRKERKYKFYRERVVKATNAPINAKLANPRKVNGRELVAAIKYPTIGAVNAIPMFCHSVMTPKPILADLGGKV